MAAAAPSVLHAQRGTLPRPATRAERTNYAETSHHADVIAFLDSLVAMRAPLVVTELGRSTEGRVLPLVIASKPQVRTPAEARALGRPIVYVQANIHAGEVEGKEAVQALLRELSVATGPTVLDSMVLLVVPIYNADGNERFGDQARNRGAQNGPALIGLRPNAQELDLNRDYIKVEAPKREPRSRPSRSGSPMCSWICTPRTAAITAITSPTRRRCIRPRRWRRSWATRCS
jgi:murein tripeptide amidase MpaA